MLKSAKILINTLYIIYLAMVLFLCFYKFSSTGLNLSGYFLGIRLDRYAHFAMFFPYPFITWLTCRYTTDIGFIKKHAIAITFISGLVFACLTEVCQDLFFKSRQGDVFDFAADSISIAAGTIIIAITGTPAVKYLDSILSRKKQTQN